MDLNLTNLQQKREKDEKVECNEKADMHNIGARGPKVQNLCSPQAVKIFTQNFELC